ncbi:protein DpdH [Kitasatospora sp. NPDC056184]|uniref:protein DpdH n=1 Tax=Kitasatospora sp. NPDC056184 TaxID=3345738 RepID=UPI0035E1ADBB
MAELTRYVCWTTEDVVSTIHTEAVVGSSAAFLATHTPLRIHRSRINGRTIEPSGAVVSEQDVLKDFLERRSDTGTLLVPIVGESGSGKSHLVRWIRENIPFRDQYKVIYLEKSRTSLRNVIDDLLKGVDDEDVVKVKEDLRTLGDGMDEAQLARRLVAELHLALSDTKAADFKGDVRSLVGPRGLARLLQDPATADIMLEPGKFVPEYASQLLRDRKPNEAERPPRFSANDLPITGEFRKAHLDTQKVVQLLNSRPNLKEAAVALLNDHLERAVQRVFSLGVGRILDIMIKVREIVAREGKEIVLLIEDFALIQGVQRDLLDAVTEASTREGRSAIAPMRTLMAITSGYFEGLPETALTRISEGVAYNLDIVFGETDDGSEQIAEFVSRYLNAARVGRNAVEESRGLNVPVKCQSCPVKAACHEAFGESGGVGLYPFNRIALQRLAHSVAPKDKPWSFVPRTMLGSVVIPILRDGVDRIEDGTFPGSDFSTTYRRSTIDLRVPNVVTNYLIDVEDPEQGRRVALLQYWAEDPSNVQGIPQGVSEAFSLLPSPEGGVPPQPEHREREQEEKPRLAAGPVAGPATAVSVPNSLRKRLESIEEWTHGAPLPQDVSGDLRKAVARAVYYRYGWNLPPVKPLSHDEAKAGWPVALVRSDTVSIEGAVAENLVTTKRRVTIARNPGNGEFLKSVVQLAAKAGRPRGEDTIRLAELADENAGLMWERLVEATETGDDDLVTGIRVSLLGAAFAGQVMPGRSEEEELFAAVFHTGDGWARDGSALDAPRWSAALAEHLKHRCELVMLLRRSLGRGQGAGKVSVIDAARALPLFRRALDGWDWDSVLDLPKWAKGAASPFRRWTDLLTEQIDGLSGVLVSIRRHYAGGALTDLVGEVHAALDDALSVNLGGISRAKLDQVAGLRERIKGLDASDVQRLERDVESLAANPGSVRQRVLIAGALRDGRLRVLDEFLSLCDADLDLVLAAMERRSAGLTNNSAHEVTALLDRWADLVKGHEEAMEDAADEH